jgi:hypothetical protein
MDDQGTNRAGGGVRFRKLRIAWSVFWGMACILLAVLWVWSYWYWDRVNCQYSGLAHVIRIMSIRGGAYIELKDYDSSIGVFQTQLSKLTNGVAILDNNGNQVHNWWFYKFDDSAYVPYWMVTLPTGALAAAPWFGCRFKLRTSLIATTLVAVALGLAVYLARR